MIHAEIEYVKQLNRPVGVGRYVLSRHISTPSEPWVSYRVKNDKIGKW